MPADTQEKPKEKIGVGIDRLICERRVAAMQEEFNAWKATMKEIKEVINPVRGFFDEDQPNQGKKIDHRTQLDTHPRRCARTLGQGMTSGMTSPARPWFKLAIDDPELMELSSVKSWVDIVQERMTNVYSRSNIYTALTNVYEEDGSFGTAAMMLTPDQDTIIRARNFTIGEYWLSLGPDGRINGFARKYWMQVSALVKEFGKDNCTQEIKDCYEKLSIKGSIDKWVAVIHLIEENDERIDGSKHFKHMPYRSLQWIDGSPKEQFLRVGGFKRFPVLAPRWQTITSSDIWGKGAPGWDALGDSRMLMKLQKKKMIGLDKQTNPPTVRDAMSGEANTLPGADNVETGNENSKGMRALYQVKFDLGALLEAIAATKNDISETFYTPLFMMLMNTDRTNITAREVAELHETKLLMLGPVLECLESELLDPMIELTFEIMQEAGLIPEPPPELEGVDIKIEYVSILAQAQKMVGTSAIDQVVEFIGKLIAVWPEAKDKLDVDEAIDTYAEYVGIPVRLIRSAEAVAKIRKAAADAMAKQQQGMAAMNMADGAKTLSEAKLGANKDNQNSALDAVIAALTGKPMSKNPARQAKAGKQ